jgi:ankyrin repeat protein
MPAKKSSKKSSKTRETTLVPHAAPQLASLLERAKGGKRSDVQQYLSAGGSPNVLVQVQLAGMFTAPLLCGLVLSKHREAAESVKLLLQAGAAANATLLDESQEERTALLIASHRPGGLAIVQALLEAGVDPCYQTSDKGVSALYLTAIFGCTSTVDCSVSLLQFLLQQKGVNVNQRDNKGNTAVSSAASSGSAAAVRLLLEYGADASIKNLQGQCAMFAAVSKGLLHVVQLLVKHGLSINVTDNRGRSLLMETTRGGAEHVAEFLIQQGLSVNAADAHQHTALYCAAAFSSATATVRLLLEHGADVNALADKGMTPLHRAATAAQLQNAEVLLAAGADVCRTAESGASPLHLACTQR